MNDNANKTLVAFLGLLIVAGLAVKFGCPAAEPEQCLEDPQPAATAPEQSVVVPARDLGAELDGLGSVASESQRDIQHLRQAVETLKGQLEQLNSAPKSCPLPQTDPDILRRIETLEARRECQCEPPRQAEPPKQSALDQAKATARETGRKLFVIFTRNDDQCPACEGLAHGALADQACMDTVTREYVVHQVFVNRDQQLANEYKVTRTPAGLIYDPQADQWGRAFIVPSSPRVLLAKLFGDDDGKATGSRMRSPLQLP